MAALSTQRSRTWTLLVLVAICATGPLAAPPQRVLADAPGQHWRTIRDDEGITTWESERPGQPLSSFRARGVFDESIWELLAVLEDVNRAAEWTSHCQEMRRLPESSAETLFVYARMDAPWPVRDRDVVTRVNVTYASATELKIHIQSVPYRGLSEIPGVVRMPKMIASYRFRALSAERTQVEYQIELDPGGTLPDWVKHMIAKNLAHDTLARLRERTRWAGERSLYRVRTAELESVARKAGFRG